MTEAPWETLRAELDSWGEAERTAKLWWRDDDAGDNTAALSKLLGLARDTGIPLAVAVVPAEATRALVEACADAPVRLLQHGYAHRNHAPETEKKMELGPHRRAEMVVAEIATGWQALDALSGGRALPVMVPPWNRIARGLVPMLPELGFRGLSTFAPRGRAEPVAGLLQVNCHADIVDWKGTRGFAGTAAAVAQLAGHLRARRTGEADPGEPTGLMTHHLVHDAGCWDFLERLFEHTGEHPAARWLDAAAVFRLREGT